MKNVILLHGFRGSHHGLDEIVKKLKKLGYNAVNPDLPGSGDSAELDNKTLNGYADWLHNYTKQFKEKPYIVGHSMGSIVVSHYLEKYPNDVQKKVVLMSPIFRTKAGQRSSNITYTLTNGFLHILPRKPRKKLLGSKPVSFCVSHFLTIDKTQQKRIDELHYKYSGRFSSANSLMADMKISMKQQTVCPKGKKVLYIIGHKDRLTKVKVAKLRAEEYGAELIDLPDSGHLINYERPSEVATAIDQFLSAV